MKDHESRGDPVSPPTGRHLATFVFAVDHIAALDQRWDAPSVALWNSSLRVLVTSFQKV